MDMSPFEQEVHLQRSTVERADFHCYVWQEDHWYQVLEHKVETSGIRAQLPNVRMAIAAKRHLLRCFLPRIWDAIFAGGAGRDNEAPSLQQLDGVVNILHLNIFEYMGDIY